MNWATAILILVVIGGVYKIASERGKRKVAEQVVQRDEALDNEEIANDRENWNNTDAGDNLNDAIGGKGRGKGK
jgi:hypothetical protein